jgi:exonuclease SbcC
MMLKKLVLQNFRSYGDQPTTVEFGPGLLLFEGEIGSGKSSILYAIEFALFGLGELDSKHLIRGSSDDARVELDFEVSGREYKVTRSIQRKKGKGRQVQTRGWIEEPDGKETEYAPTELRARILQILNFKEKQGKSSSRIYRYAVFTPQELMKEVLSQSSDERIDTLRRAFGIEDYSFAESNSELVVKHLNDLGKTYGRLAEGLREREILLDEIKGSVSDEEISLKSTETKLSEVEARILEVKNIVTTLELESKKVTSLQTLIPELEKTLRMFQSQSNESKKELSAQVQAEKEVRSAESILSSLRPEFEKYEKDRARLRELGAVREESHFIDNRISSFEASISARKKSIELQINSVDIEISALKEKVFSYTSLHSSIQALENEEKALRKDAATLPSIQSDISNLSVEIGSSRGIISSRRSEYEDLKAKLRRVSELNQGSTCPLCGQTLNVEHLGKVRSEYDQSIAHLDAEIIRAESDLNANLEKERELEIKRDKCLANQRRLEETLAQISDARETFKLIADYKERLEKASAQRNDLLSELKSGMFAAAEERDLQELTRRRESIRDQVREVSLLESRTREFEDSGSLRKFQSAELSASRRKEIDETLSFLEEKTSLLEREIAETAREIKSRKSELEESEPAMLKFAKAKRDLDSLNEERSELRQSVAVISKEIESHKREIQRLGGEIANLRGKEAKGLLYKGVSKWLESYFVPAVKDIESYQFSSINEEFNELLQRFFSSLVEDGDLSITVDDSFSPIVEQSGYELDVNSLSGGERTAVALAYRLALSFMVKRANEAMHASLLILDEPTEGFSKQQIYRMRNVIEELNFEQVIIVSHEADLESMADHVYRVEKVNGQTQVTVAS